LGKIKILHPQKQGRRQKNFQGGRGQRIIDRKNAKKRSKNSTIKPLPGGGQRKKTEKKAKKTEK